MWLLTADVRTLFGSLCQGSLDFVKDLLEDQQKSSSGNTLSLIG